MTDWETFIHDYNDEKIFKVSRYKKIYTPFEQEKKYIDEITMDYLGDYMLNSSIELPNKELLVGMIRVYVDEKTIDGKIVETLKIGDKVDYFHLKDIELSDITNTDEYLFLQGKCDDEEANDEI